MEIPILLPKIFDYPFTYENSEKIKLNTGDLVKVPFGSKKEIGIVWHTAERTEKKFKIKKIEKKINLPSISKNLINFIDWFSKYNMVPLGLTLKLCLTNHLSIENMDDNLFSKYKIQKKLKFFSLNNEQKKSLLELKKNKSNYNVTVLQGVTGSGKTIVYFERIKDILKKNQQTLILLPEIALTSQFKLRFEEYFKSEAAIWHSKITAKNKKILLNGIMNNKIKILIGARSALFLPFFKLGLIIVDEEHDGSYKQNEGISYHARDMAVLRASTEGIPIHLVTSIPSVETYNNIKNKKYKITRIKKRYKNASFPKFHIIDLKKERPNKNKWISPYVIKEVKKFLDRKDQVLFFLNRRGFSPSIFDLKLNKVFSCPRCSVNLNFHKISGNALCHYCGFKKNINIMDQKNDYVFCGPGVERIYEEVKEIFPNKNIEIFSSDTLRNKAKNTQFASKIENREIDILVGTQLISKGFHFPKLNCIVVVDPDLNSHGFDLRNSEKNVQLYHQLVGRAGREGFEASIFFQTFVSDDHILKTISEHDPHKFLEQEIVIRKEKNLPPFCRFISLIISSPKQEESTNFSLLIKRIISKVKNIELLGPVDAPIFKIKNKFRSRLLIRCSKNRLAQKSIWPILKKLKIPSRIKLAVDVDPLNFN